MANLLSSQHPTEVGVNGATVTLTLNVPARAGQTITLTYESGPLQDTAGNAAPAFRQFAVTNNTPGAAGPEPLRAWVVGTVLTLLFDGPLDTESRPAGSAFRVDTRDLDDDWGTIRGTGTAIVADNEVTAGRTGTNEVKVILYFDEALDAISVPAAGDFVVTRETPEPKLVWTPASVAVAVEGYGLPVGARLVGTPRVGISNSTYGRDYRFGYGLGVLEQGKVNFELAVEAQRRESPTAGEVSNGFIGRATLGW